MLSVHLASHYSSVWYNQGTAGGEDRPSSCTCQPGTWLWASRSSGCCRDTTKGVLQGYFLPFLKKREIQPSKSQEQLLSYHPWPTESFKALRPSHAEGGGRGGLIAPSTGRMGSDKEDFPRTWPAWSRKGSEGKLLFEMLKIAPSATPSTKTPPYL